MEIFNRAKKVAKKVKVEIEKESALESIEEQGVCISTVGQALLVIMERHMGKENSASSEQLFYEIYGFKPKKDMESFIKMKILANAVAHVRKNSKCMIGFKRIPGQTHRELYVITNKKEAQELHCHYDYMIAGLHNQKKRLDRAVKEKWHKQDWTLSGKEPKLLE